MSGAKKTRTSVCDFLAEQHQLAFSPEGQKYLLEYAATLLRVLSDPSHPTRDRDTVCESAKAVAAVLDNIRMQWEDGDVLHFEDALGLRRPRRWNRKAVQRRARYKVLASHLVRKALDEGAVTPDVFRIVHESGQLPESVSASQIEKWYYDCKNALPEAYSSHD